MTSEFTDAQAFDAAATDELDRVLRILAQPKHLASLLETRLGLSVGFRHSICEEPDPLSLGVRMRRWVSNLAAAARGDLFRLTGPPSPTPAPHPGLVQRWLHHADREACGSRKLARDNLLKALQAVACDIVQFPGAGAIIASEIAKY